MAGFFGLFNYEKAGPGIRKDAPQKRKPIVFFETFFRNFWKFIIINVVYCIISLPIITNGFANAGVTHVVRNTALDKHSFGLSDFFDTIKKNFKQSLIVGILNIIATVAIIFDVIFFYNLRESEIIAAIGLGLALFLAFSFKIMNYYIWTMLITFGFGTFQLYKNCFKFVFINFWKNILCFLIELGMYAIYAIVLYLSIFLSTTYIYLVWALAMIIFVCTFPCYRALMIQYFVFPPIVKYIIEPYYKEHPFEDIEKRRDLGLEIEELKRYDENGELITDEDELVFEDNV